MFLPPTPAPGQWKHNKKMKLQGGSEKKRKKSGKTKIKIGTSTFMNRTKNTKKK